MYASAITKYVIILIGCVAISTQGIQPPTGCLITDSGKTWRCTITKVSDCQKLLRDTPYARNVYCPGAFQAAENLADNVAAQMLNTSRRHMTRSFTYFQTLPDIDKVPAGEESQTRLPCLSSYTPDLINRGIGRPLCRLLALETSFARRPPSGNYASDTGNPVGQMKGLGSYISHLLFPELFPASSGTTLKDFHSGSKWDFKVRSLGASGAAIFEREAKNFNPNELYMPWNNSTNYDGISTGGGSGWGGEIKNSRGTLLSFGGGGGGGVTSHSKQNPVSKVGSGGGGGVNFGDAWRRNGKSLAGLGLGAGTGNEADKVRYEYYPAGKQELQTNTYSPKVIKKYSKELSLLKDYLKNDLNSGGTVTLEGGGGAGGGASFLEPNGQAILPNPLSTEGAFNFKYTFSKSPASRSKETPSELYAALGEIYNDARASSTKICHGYADYACTCRTSAIYVAKEVQRRFGTVPDWLALEQALSQCPKPTTTKV